MILPFKNAKDYFQLDLHLTYNTSVLCKYISFIPCIWRWLHIHKHAYSCTGCIRERGGFTNTGRPAITAASSVCRLCCRVRARDYVVTSGRPAINGWSASPRARLLHLHGAACDVRCFSALQTQRSRTSAVLFHLHGAVCDVSCSSLARERVPDVSSGLSAINDCSASLRAGLLHLHEAVCDVRCFPALLVSLLYSAF